MQGFFSGFLNLNQNTMGDMTIWSDVQTCTTYSLEHRVMTKFAKVNCRIDLKFSRLFVIILLFSFPCSSFLASPIFFCSVACPFTRFETRALPTDNCVVMMFAWNQHVDPTRSLNKLCGQLLKTCSLRHSYCSAARHFALPFFHFWNYFPCHYLVFTFHHHIMFPQTNWWCDFF